MKPSIPYYQSSVDTCRLLLMLCVCLNLFGVPTPAGDLIQIFLNFAPCAFFILSGYLILRHSDDRGARILRTVRRSGITFLVLLVGYLALNLLFEREQTLVMLSSRRFWYDFIVMNNWNLSIGRPIWFVQAMFYAYIIIYFLHRFKLLRYDWIIASVFLVIAVLTGELSELIHFRFLGESFIPGNFFTRALPYLLIGHFLRRIEPLLIEMRSHAWWIAAVGLGMMFGEYFLLNSLGVYSYYGHLLGMGVLAVALCVLVITAENEEEPPFFVLSFVRNARLITYYLCSPVYYLLVRWIIYIGVDRLTPVIPFIGVVVILVCLTVALLHEVLLYLSGKVIRRIRIKRKIQRLSRKESQ